MFYSATEYIFATVNEVADTKKPILYPDSS